jgi:protoheme IX farnesyltransferase
MKPASDLSELPDGSFSVGAPITTVARPSELRSKLADYYELTKPRMNFLILITTMVGYYMASSGPIEWLRLASTLLGTLLCASSAGVINQVIERKYDALMQRTRNRPLPAGRVEPIQAFAFGAACGLAGIFYLLIAVNALTALLGAFTLLSYVLIYTPLKRVTTLNTVIGAVPGAIPPVMGFTAASGALSPAAIVIFGILFLWQMPHFLAIAILYRRDYAAGGFIMLPVVDPHLESTRRQILLYGLALIPMSLMPSVMHIAGAAYFTAAMLLGLAFLTFGVSCAATRSREDARKLFFASIIYLPLLLGMLMLDKM